MDAFREHGEALADLRRSGLSDATIERAGLRPARVPEDLPGAGSPAIVIPYFDLEGAELDPPFRRWRLLRRTSDLPRYVSPAGVGNHAYLPPLVEPSVWEDTQVPLIITEGEKKALKAVQEGFPALALSGVYSWISRSILVPASAVRAEGRHQIRIELPDPGDRRILEAVVPEFLRIRWHGRRVYVIFDRDQKPNRQVTQAAFELALWLASQGADVRWVPLPADPQGGKVGLDDYLVRRGRESLVLLLANERWTFPAPDSPRDWVFRHVYHKRPQGSERLHTWRIGQAVVAFLDKNGVRLRHDMDNVQEIYYCPLGEPGTTYVGTYASGGSLRDHSLGQFLMKELVIPSDDHRLVNAIYDRYLTQEPIRRVRPHVVTYHDAAGDLYFQATDRWNVRVTADTIEVVPNGTNDVLLLPGKVDPLDPQQLLQEVQAARQHHRGYWAEALHASHLAPVGTLRPEEVRALLVALLHCYPWLRRWRGLQLPILQILGEHGSGKTDLLSLIQYIPAGRSHLVGTVEDMRDWVAQARAAPGVLAMDNVNRFPEGVRLPLQNEVARLVTSDDPVFDLREYYTRADLGVYPVDSVFAVTALGTPFTATDIPDRSFIVRLQRIPPGRYRSDWLATQRAERPRWVAEVLCFLQDFLRLCHAEWDLRYEARHRLRHFEQVLVLALRVLGWERPQAISLVQRLAEATWHDRSLTDDVQRALAAFVRDCRQRGLREARVPDAVRWAKYERSEEFGDVPVLCHPSALARYLVQNQATLEQLLEIQITYDADGALLIVILPPDRKEGDYADVVRNGA